MFVGHAALAAALVGLGAVVVGSPRERAAALAVVAGVFATLPDLDIVYALTGLLDVVPGTPAAVATAFWGTGNLVHRTVTHSLPVAVAVAATVGLWTRARCNSDRAGGTVTRWATVVGLGAAGIGLGTLAVVATVSGVVAAAVTTLFLVAAFLAAEASVRWRGLPASEVAGVALVALVSHPFGDVFTGTPPAMLYPFDATLVGQRVVLHPDPTLHLLSAFWIELLAIWAGVAVVLWLLGQSLRRTVAPRAALGVGYAASLPILPAPTLDASYPFVFSVVAVGTVGVVPRVRLRERRLELPEVATAVVTGLAAITVAGGAYTLAYLFA